MSDDHGARAEIIDTIYGFPYWNYDGQLGVGGWAEDLADAILTALDEQTEHIAEFTETTWVIKHPLDCRKDLFGCKFNGAHAKPLQMPDKPGFYVVEFREDGLLSFQELDKWQKRRLSS